MKIKLLRASTTLREVDVAADATALEIRRLSIDLMFEAFQRNETHLWPIEGDMRGSAYVVRVTSDEGDVLKAIDIREIAKEAGLAFLGRKIDVEP
jgi:hypothetical protein